MSDILMWLRIFQPNQKIIGLDPRITCHTVSDQRKLQSYFAVFDLLEHPDLGPDVPTVRNIPVEVGADQLVYQKLVLRDR